MEIIWDLEYPFDITVTFFLLENTDRIDEILVPLQLQLRLFLVNRYIHTFIHKKYSYRRLKQIFGPIASIVKALAS
jgi:hypothetical protein